jgi:hypothetical protein
MDPMNNANAAALVSEVIADLNSSTRALIARRGINVAADIATIAAGGPDAAVAMYLEASATAADDAEEIALREYIATIELTLAYAS